MSSLDDAAPTVGAPNHATGPVPILSKGALIWLETILQERFGLTFILTHHGPTLRMRLMGAPGHITFDRLVSGFIEHEESMPCTHWDATSEGWLPIFNEKIPMPGIAKVTGPVIDLVGEEHVIHFDILGLTYWMFARIEEHARTDLDVHGRFPAKSSHAYKHGYLDRPIVDEWLSILGEIVKRQWPGITLKQHVGSVFVTCDVDSPFAFDGTLSTYFRRLAGDLITRRSSETAIQTLKHGPYLNRRHHHTDPHYENLLWMLDTCENNRQRCAFYFLTGGGSKYDSSYQMTEPAIESMLTLIHSRGHEIGFHPSYMTLNDMPRFLLEANTLRNTMERLGIPCDSLGGRQHYLRWETPTTARQWNEAGMTYDSTLSFADHAGFRCGTSHEFPLFDTQAQRALAVRERPLIIMDCSVIEQRYMGMGFSNASLGFMQLLKRRSIATGGRFTLLWHNSFFHHRRSVEFFKALIRNE